MHRLTIRRASLWLPNPRSLVRNVIHSNYASTPVYIIAVKLVAVVVQVDRGAGHRKAADTDKEFRRRAAALNVRISPYFKRS
jgi:hypothetical protein